MPRIENSISLGNILTLAALMLSVGGAYVTVKADVADIRRGAADQERRVTLLEAQRRADDSETSVLREKLAERLVGIEVALRALTISVERMQARTGH